MEWGVCNPLINNSQGYSRDSEKVGQSVCGAQLNKWSDRKGSRDFTALSG